MGTDLNLVADDGTTALCIAAQYGSLDFAENLIDSGADIHAGGIAPVFLACQEGGEAMVFLIANMPAAVFVLQISLWIRRSCRRCQITCCCEC